MPLKPEKVAFTSSTSLPSTRLHATKQFKKMGTPQKKVTIAIEGCCHGELDKIYGTLQYLEKVENKKIDLLISCGDFQAVRNKDDLETMACPDKYKDMQTFYKYYSGEKVAPIPTLFIGGNHEASNHLWELYYGGWVAPKIYFLGFTGVVKFAGLRIGGLSGIYKSHDYYKGHTERLPYSDSAMRSIYHIRDFEVYRLNQIKQPLDIFLSHDWPAGIVDYGNKERLLAYKKFLRNDVESGELGSPPAMTLLRSLQPSYWFSAHLHTKFSAQVPHDSGLTTRFLSLDKCLPGRDFLQVLELDAKGPLEFSYDEEWLAILKSTAGLTNLRPGKSNLPGMGGLRTGASAADLEYVADLLERRGSSTIPNNFTPTVPAFNPQTDHRKGTMPRRAVTNPQTVELMQMLGLQYDLDHGYMSSGSTSAPVSTPAAISTPSTPHNPEEIDIGDDDNVGSDAPPSEGAEEDPLFQSISFA